MRDRRHLLLTAAHLVGLWTIAAAQPLLEVLGRAPEFFVAHRAQPPDILLLVAVLVLAAPLVLVLVIALGAAIGPRRRARRRWGSDPVLQSQRPAQLPHGAGRRGRALLEPAPARILRTRGHG